MYVCVRLSVCVCMWGGWGLHTVLITEVKSNSEFGAGFSSARGSEINVPRLIQGDTNNVGIRIPSPTILFSIQYHESYNTILYKYHVCRRRRGQDNYPLSTCALTVHCETYG